MYRRSSWIVRSYQRPRNRINQVLDVKLRHYDLILARPINPMWDPISVRMDDQMEMFRGNWFQRNLPCFKGFTRWLQGIEAVMASAQWRQRVYVPRRGLLGRFLDIKIERWFMSWVASVQVGR